MTTLVCFALKEEAAPFQARVADRPGVDILLVGIGRANAEKAIRRHFATHSPALVLTGGFAGGLNPDLKLGDVIFESPAGEAGTSAPDCHQRLLAAGAKPARFWCVDHIATTAAEKKKLRAATGADAVEMESAAIQAVCRERGIPCVTVRVISDTAEEDLPLDFNALAKPDKSLDLAKLAWTVARSPGKIGALLELQKKTSQAARQLAGVLEKVISA
jgi:adenosylhomocysteine nucleosidase